MKPDEHQFYLRHFSLAEIGEEGQQRLKQSRILVIGAGGLGCAALQYLAAAGIGQLTVCDGDQVELSNLHRQPLYRPKDIGQWKSDCAAFRCAEQNPWIQVKGETAWVTAENIEELVQDHDLVLDCTDNPGTNLLIHDACYLSSIPLVAAAIHRFEGIIHHYEYDHSRQTCKRCLWPDGGISTEVGDCAGRGVIGALPGVFGILQAQIAIHHLLRIETLPHATSWIMDLRTMQSRSINWEQRENCSLCTTQEVLSLSALHPHEQDSDIAALEDVGTSVRLIDIREPGERLIQPLSVQLNVEHKPLSTWNSQCLEKHQSYVLLCAKGRRSKQLAQKLRLEGYAQIFSLKGGVDALTVR
ncbi:putative adenylyltransferase/sulfurtransferase MoeZ [Nitrosomonas nitrosa]|uniref:Putative adenylyltransferase/sulfurtransferase MoeZ n=1 Tax=Nitrosomonas nitrosa TaxID=52442 RepID=A0A8H8Z172_9PROT|nr:ThiF family adenylyltransferase [Nitrosomonas nitrosa]CAE6508082.1 putative adenylyltransferase/sulfurtransferase MoeZ [Nitrosomonas nitrosa]